MCARAFARSLCYATMIQKRIFIHRTLKCFRIYTHRQLTQCYTVTYRFCYCCRRPPPPSPFVSQPITQNFHLLSVTGSCLSSVLLFHRRPSPSFISFRSSENTIFKVSDLKLGRTMNQYDCICILRACTTTTKCERSATSYARLALCAVVSRAH